MEQFIEKVVIWGQSVKNAPFIEKVKANQRMVLISGGVLFLCFVMLIVWSLFNSSDDLVQDFEKAMVEEDKGELKSLLVSEHSKLEIDDAFLNKLIQQGKEDDDFLSDTTLIMSTQMLLHEEKEVEASAFLNNHDLTIQELMNQGSLYVKKNDSLFGQDYVIAVRPSYLKMNASVEPTEIKLDGKPIQLKKGSTELLHGPILPGKYKIEATKKYPFSSVIDTEEVNLFKKDRTAKINLNLKGQKVGFKSRIDDTELFINNQSTQQKFGSKGVEFGPVSTNGTLKAYGQLTLPWGTVKSDPIDIKNSYMSLDITPNPFSNEKIKNEVIQVIHTYAKEYIDANLKRDAELFTTLDEENKKDWSNKFTNMERFRAESTYKGEAIKTVISVKGTTLSQVDGSNVYKIKVPVQFHRHEREYGRFDNVNEPLKEKVNNTYVWLIHNSTSNKWEITGLDSMFMSRDIFKDSTVVTTNH